MPFKDPIRARENARLNAAKRRAAARAVREQNRQVTLARRPCHALPDLCWAAGLFEGEGTATLLNSGRKSVCRPHISVTSTDIDVVNVFQRMWPGRLDTKSLKNPNARPATIWVLNTNMAVKAFILDILPHIKTPRVREKLELVLADVTDRMRWTRDAGVRARSEERMIVIRNLNRRGMPQ